MSKVRDLKKDVKQMVRLFLNECYTHLAFSPSLNSEHILDIISDVVELERSVIKELSKKDKNTNYGDIASTFYASIVELAERLNSLEY